MTAGTQNAQNAQQNQNQKQHQNTTPRQPDNRSPFWESRPAAFCVWLLGVLLTSLMITQLFIIPVPVCYIIGACVQYVFSVFENEFWRTRKLTLASGIALFFDIGSNAAGIWPWVNANLDKTDFWRMINDVLGSNNPPSIIVKIVICLLVGTIVANGPEYLWNRK